MWEEQLWRRTKRELIELNGLLSMLWMSVRILFNMILSLPLTRMQNQQAGQVSKLQMDSQIKIQNIGREK